MAKTPKNLNDDFYQELETCDSLFNDFAHRYAKLKSYGNCDLATISEPDDLCQILTSLIRHYKDGDV